jgi:hypothetical protein
MRGKNIVEDSTVIVNGKDMFGKRRSGIDKIQKVIDLITLSFPRHLTLLPFRPFIETT